MPTLAELRSGFDLGDWVVLPAKGVLRLGDKEIRPEPRVFDVLLALAQRDGDVVSKDELIAEVWDGKAFSDEPILRCVSILRSHFDDHRPFRYIGTLPRRGYRLLQPVRPHSSPVPSGEQKPKSGRHSVVRWKWVAAVIVTGFVATAILTSITDSDERFDPGECSLAVMPFDNLSGDTGNAFIADGIKNSLAHSLAAGSDLTVKNARIQYDVEPSVVSKRLGVGCILTAALQLQGDTLNVSWQVARGADDVIIGAGQVSGRLEQLFTLQRKLANTVREELVGTSAPQLVTQREPDSDAYISYMRGMYLFEHREEGDNLEAAMELFQESIERDKEYGPAYLALASAYALLPTYRGLPVEETLRYAIATVQDGVDVDNTIEDAAASIHGFVHHQQKRWEESEAAHTQAVQATVLDSNSFNWYSRMLSSVGRLEDALYWALQAEAIDPDNAVAVARIAIAYTWLQESDKAYEYFQRADELGAKGRSYSLGYAFYWLQLGRIEQAQQLAAAGSQAVGAPSYWVEPVFSAWSDPTRRESALQVIDEAWSEKVLAPEIVLVIRTLLGDVDGAMEIAQLLELPGEAFEMDLLFIPEMQPLRDHPDFMQLLERLGVVQYWQKAGCDWDGRVVRCGDA